MLNTTDITASLQSYWQSHGPTAVPCQFPGVPLDATHQTAWIEFWITQVREESKRPGACDRLLILMDIHCFSRHKFDKREINRLIDQSRAAILNQSILMTNPDLPDHHLGIIRFQEPITRELTRHDSEHTLQHQVISVTATAEEF